MNLMPETLGEEALKTRHEERRTRKGGGYQTGREAQLRAPD